MGHFRPANVIDPAKAPGGFEHRPEPVRADQHGGNAPPFDCDLVEQTARRATASITVGEDDGITGSSAPHSSGRMTRAGWYEPGPCRRCRGATQLRVDAGEELVGVELHVRPQSDALAVERVQPGCELGRGHLGWTTGLTSLMLSPWAVGSLGSPCRHRERGRGQRHRRARPMTTRMSSGEPVTAAIRSSSPATTGAPRRSMRPPVNDSPCCFTHATDRVVPSKTACRMSALLQPSRTKMSAVLVGAPGCKSRND